MARDARNPFTIDETRLDDEWLAQPGMMRDAGERLADARHDAAKAKVRLKVTTAELSLAVRGDPEKYDLPKRPTNDAVEATVLTLPEWEKANAVVLAAEHLVDVLSAECSAVVDRRRALQGLTDLAGLNYFNLEPRSRAGRELHQEAAKNSARKPLRERERDDDDR